jgi:hypothetical protein
MERFKWNWRDESNITLLMLNNLPQLSVYLLGVGALTIWLSFS